MVDSLRKFDAGIDWRLFLVDDLGPDGDELDQLYADYKKDSRIKIIRNHKNSGFAVSNNNGVSRGHSPIILLLNSDIEICEDGWLRRMTDEFSDLEVGVVGARLLYPEDSVVPNRPAGKIQHAGVVFNLLGQPYHIYQGWRAEHPRVIQRLEMNAVTGACLMTRRNIYQTIGGLDPIYTKGNFEDVQYCLQVRKLGGKVIYQPLVKLYHFSGGSNNSETARFNEQIFRMRCKDIIEYDEWKYW